MDLDKQWEKAVLDCHSYLDNQEKNADNLRNFASLINNAVCTERNFSRESYQLLYMKELDHYAEVMDTTEEQGGLNNYGGRVLSCLSNTPTECSAWKCALSVESPKLQSLEKYHNLSQLAQSSVVGADRLEELLLFPARPDPSAVPVSKPQSTVNTCGNVMDPVSGQHGSLSSAKPPPSHKAAMQSSRPLQSCPTLFPHQAAAPQPTRISACSNSFTNLYGQGSTSPDIKSKPQGAFSDVKQREWETEAKRNEVCMKRGREECTDEEDAAFPATSLFRTARQQLAINNQKNHNKKGVQGSVSNYGTNKKSLGTRRGVSSKFVPPVMNADTDDSARKPATHNPDSEEPVDERLKNIDSKMIDLIMAEIMEQSHKVSWDDIAGLQFAKKTIQEIVVWPLLRPDIFTGLRGPPKGLLLFGPPGTGKTLIGKCVASQSKSTFFSISASSLTSKWVGEGEKMVRALFAVARVHQPAVVFIDEIDSLLSQRSDGEHESSRRIKTEFLVQLDGATTGEADRILVIGATNRPQELDEAARRRFVKRLYIPLPESEARQQIVSNLLSQQKHQLSADDLQQIVQQSAGYSGADMANLCREAALGPIRSLPFSDIETMTAEQVRPIVFKDFMEAFKQVRASVSDKDLKLYYEWNKQFGSWDIE